MALDAHHLAWRKIGNEENILADELFWFIIGSDAAEDGAVNARTIIDGELEELLRLLHLLAVLDVANADVHFFKRFKVNVFLQWRGNIIGSLVGLLGVVKLLELSLDGFVFNLFEEQRRCAELVSWLEKFG